MTDAEAQKLAVKIVNGVINDRKSSDRANALLRMVKTLRLVRAGNDSEETRALLSMIRQEGVSSEDDALFLEVLSSELYKVYLFVQYGIVNGPQEVEEKKQRPRRRLVLLFDGTWNRREHTTNVWRTRLLIEHSTTQLVYYDEGVGTAQFEKIGGGAFGNGLSKKVLSAYLWLMENYRPNSVDRRQESDEIFVFGFSRGAFTARSLVGFLSLCGLLRTESPVNVERAFELSREPGMTRHTHVIRDFRDKYSIDIGIKFLGLWDTVGALGIHRLDLPLFERYRFHKTEDLHTIVDHARHALALDEHRELFNPSLWMRTVRNDQTLEQRWFTGSHANVGGGYQKDGLFLRPLQWMLDEATALGLEIGVPIRALVDAFYYSLPRDSLDEIGLGAYYLTQRFRRFDRTIRFGDPSTQTVDYTVLQRWLWHRNYNPHALRPLLGETKPQVRPPSIRVPISDLPRLIHRVQASLNPDHRAGFVIL